MKASSKRSGPLSPSCRRRRQHFLHTSRVESDVDARTLRASTQVDIAPGPVVKEEVEVVIVEYEFWISITRNDIGLRIYFKSVVPVCLAGIVSRLDRHIVAQRLIKTHLPTISPPRTPRPLASGAALHPRCTAELTGAEETPLHPGGGWRYRRCLSESAVDVSDDVRCLPRRLLMLMMLGVGIGIFRVALSPWRRRSLRRPLSVSSLV